MKWKGEYTKTVQTIFDLGHRIKWEMEQSSREKKKQIIEKKKKKNKSSGKNRWKNKTKQKIGKLLETGSPWLGPLTWYNTLSTELRGNLP